MGMGKGDVAQWPPLRWPGVAIEPPAVHPFYPEGVHGMQEGEGVPHHSSVICPVGVGAGGNYCLARLTERSGVLLGFSGLPGLPEVRRFVEQICW